jgi:hypothetical protein
MFDLVFQPIVRDLRGLKLKGLAFVFGVGGLKSPVVLRYIISSPFNFTFKKEKEKGRGGPVTAWWTGIGRALVSSPLCGEPDWAEPRHEIRCLAGHAGLQGALP